MAKQRARRGEPPLPAATVVIRGDLPDPDALAESAQRNFDVYGFYGISVFAEALDLSWAVVGRPGGEQVRGRAVARAVHRW